MIGRRETIYGLSALTLTGALSSCTTPEEDAHTTRLANFIEDHLDGGAISSSYCRTNSGVNAADLSTPVNSDFVQKLKDVGADTVLRYYDYGAFSDSGRNETLSGKRLRQFEIPIIRQAGLKLGIVFQHDSDVAETFIDWRKRGPEDAAEVLRLAEHFSQPDHSAIYFGVDNNFVGRENGGLGLDDEVLGYFDAIADAFVKAGAKYKIGSYGSGLTNRLLLENGLTSYRWLTASRSSGGTVRALRKQEFELMQIIPGDCGGRNIDFNMRREWRTDIGAFSV